MHVSNILIAKIKIAFKYFLAPTQTAVISQQSFSPNKQFILVPSSTNINNTILEVYFMYVVDSCVAKS